MTGKEWQLLVIQIFIVFTLLGIVFQLIRVKRAIRFEKRLNKYSVDSVNDYSKSFFDKIYDFYYETAKHFSEHISKSVFLKKYSKRFSKYLYYSDDIKLSEMDCISTKFFLGFSFVLLNIFGNVLIYKISSFSDVFLSFILGFFIFDLYLIYNYKKYRKQIEKDLLNSIIIMNNAFKSGRSTMQAIEIAIDELHGPICEEFKKIYVEISFGLSLEIAFKRFASRINIKEADYIASSITILNQTGGNIVNVFNSIEKSLFNNRKLKNELGSLTSNSKLIIKILLIFPILLFGTIFLINPQYFIPLFKTELGYLIDFLILGIYGIYIFAVKRIMIIRM